MYLGDCVDIWELGGSQGWVNLLAAPGGTSWGGNIPLPFKNDALLPRRVKNTPMGCANNLRQILRFRKSNKTLTSIDILKYAYYGYVDTWTSHSKFGSWLRRGH